MIWAAGNIIARRAKASSGLGLVVWSGAVAPLPLIGLSLWIDGPAASGGTLADMQLVTILSAVYTAVFGSLGIDGSGPLSVVSGRPLYAARPGGRNDDGVAGPGRGSLTGRRLCGGRLRPGGVAIAVLRPPRPGATPGQRRWHAQRRDVAFAGDLGDGLGAGLTMDPRTADSLGRAGHARPRSLGG